MTQIMDQPSPRPGCLFGLVCSFPPRVLSLCTGCAICAHLESPFSVLVFRNVLLPVPFFLSVYSSLLFDSIFCVAIRICTHRFALWYPSPMSCTCFLRVLHCFLYQDRSHFVVCSVKFLPLGECAATQYVLFGHHALNKRINDILHQKYTY